MQTFLPYSSYDDSAAALDRLRLGKQRVETLQIMKALVTGKGWIHHPVTKMWRGYELALLDYQRAIVTEWLSRGYKDTCWVKTSDLWIEAGKPGEDYPPFVGDEAFHASHRSNLLRKDPDWYGQFGWSEPDDLAYVYPASV